MIKPLLLAIALTLSAVMSAQPWMQQLLTDSTRKGNVTFYDYKQAFDAYNAENGIVNGFKTVDGKKVKVPWFKQFNRWAWLWETRIDPQTGAFPTTSAADELQKWMQQKGDASKDTGNWTALGPYQSDGGYAGLGRINCIAFHPTDNNTFWVGSPSGGLWVTTDGGKSWHCLTDQNTVIGVSDIVVSPNFDTDQTLFIATGDKDNGSSWSLGGQNGADNNSIGVLKSTDAGSTWQSTGLSFAVSQKKLIGRLIANPFNPAIMLVGSTDGIYRTEDGGENWSLTGSLGNIIDMEYKPGDSSIIYASTKTYGQARILKSFNTGKSWSVIKTFSSDSYRAEIAVTPHDNAYLYALVCNRSGGLEGIYKSTDNGINITATVVGGTNNTSYLYYYSNGSGTNDGQGSYDLCIAASPTNKNTVLIGGVNTWKSSDGAATWNICNMWTSYDGYNFSGAPEVHADKHNLVYRPDGTLFETNDGGVYTSTNNGSSWLDLTNNMAISQMYRLGVSATKSDLVITGLQDNGTKLYASGEWYDVKGGDGMECIIDYQNEDIQYGTYVNGEIERTTDGWSTYNTTIISDNIPGGNQGHWVAPYIMNPKNPAILYVGYANVWRTNDRGNTFNQSSTMNSMDLLRSMAISPVDTSVLFVADLSHIWRTINSGQTWSNVTNNLPISTNQITSIATSHFDANTLWVTLGGYNANRVFESADGGATWVNISDGLPNAPVMTIVQNKLISGYNQLYVGTDAGIFIKEGDLPWSRYSKGLPNVFVTELEIYYNQADPVLSKLRAATYGRGLWESTLLMQVNAAPMANFTASGTEVLLGGQVSFTDLSTNLPDQWLWTFEGGEPASSTERNPVISYNAGGKYAVTLKATNQYGSDEVTKTAYVTVNNKVYPDFLAMPQTGNYPLTVSFINYTTNATTYLWDFGNGDTSQVKNPQCTYTSPGMYSVKLVAANNEASDSLTQPDVINVTWPLPIAKFDAAPLTGIEPLSVQFNNTSEHGEVYRWDFGDGKAILEKNPLHQYPAGTYSVSLEVSNPTGSNSARRQNYIVVSPNTNSAFTDQNTGLTIYPNPAETKLTIAWPKDANGEVEITFYNILGSIVKTEKSVVNANSQTEFAVEGWPSGTYVVKVVYNETLVFKRFTVK